ncbi:hypothetical protein TVAG_305990 [Trichomonas vaginalis G3]|uniref:Uncharacterized protein n=1 Tax=Trichomonas vaginalis (strain ATCC PRA-98 / G3) TaxID=412133 RepID=A2DN91_TRIV3|nr:hypothetical protein TVAGG3_1024100 [Trichomonas vaginalis G3]EAY18079.1 hypothetical protein TVAG_305990 [Trichomonas vaginalis G3]KAI5492354.1 hypothetical protein TVAGG3_1024100 [Trichomonas vaginalis G3]|eukprot:XP_001579065.1 hypothetical protein [Trichomonas vaginalis G3]
MSIQQDYSPQTETSPRKKCFGSIPVLDRLTCDILVEEAEKDISSGYTTKQDCKFISSIVRNSINSPEKLQNLENYNTYYSKSPDRGCTPSFAKDIQIPQSTSEPVIHDKSSFFEREKTLLMSKSFTEEALLQSPKIEHQKLDKGVIKRAERALKRREKSQSLILSQSLHEETDIYAKPKPYRIEKTILQESQSKLETIQHNEELLEKKELENCYYKPINPNMKLVERARKRRSEKEK